MTPSPLEAGPDGALAGYGAVFDRVDLDGDVILPTAFSASLARMRAAGTLPRLLWQHDRTQPIGIWTRVEERPDGLWFEGRLALDTQRGREAHALIRLGALDGLSIGFSILRAVPDRATGRRLIEEAELLECSPVTFPAQPAARVAAVKTTYPDLHPTPDTPPDQPTAAECLTRTAARLTLARLALRLAAASPSSEMSYGS